jgi:release factor glutamine methyltransferase
MIEEKKKNWTLRELMQSAMQYLTKKGFDEARLNTELLLAHALHLQRIQIYTNFDKPLDDQEVAVFRSYFERRLQHEPLQYIVGSTNFMGMQFAVRKGVLIPRPETETLVEQIVYECKKYLPEQMIEILEIGTGTGNIAVSIAKFIKNAFITTIDISETALDLARENARVHHVEDRINFIHTDILGSINILQIKKYGFLVSNPPYVAEVEWKTLQPEILLHEPQEAVTDHADGLTFYKRIAEISADLLTTDGTVIVEIGCGQAESVQNIFNESAFREFSLINDMQRIPRVLCGYRKSVRMPDTVFSVN